MCTSTSVQQDSRVLRFARTARNAVSADHGQAISEYLVILGVIVIACILLAVSFQAELSTLWGTVTSSMGSIG